MSGNTKLTRVCERSLFCLSLSVINSSDKQPILVAGLHFIESNFDLVNDKTQVSPIGFDIIFPCMLEYAKDLNIKLPLNQSDLDLMLHERDLELRRYD